LIVKEDNVDSSKPSGLEGSIHIFFGIWFHQTEMQWEKDSMLGGTRGGGRDEK